MNIQGDCHCTQFSFKTDVDPVLVVQCYCKSCRRLTGSINIGCLYADTEIEFEGETNVYKFAGGSEFINKAYFCLECNVRVYNKPALEVMEGRLNIPLGCFNNTSELALVEIGVRKS